MFVTDEALLREEKKGLKDRLTEEEAGARPKNRYCKEQCRSALHERVLGHTGS